MPSPLHIPELLRSHGLNCIDVGARGGMQAHWRRYASLFQNVDLFEPDEAACASQAKRAPAGQSWFPVALGGTTGTGRLHVTKRPSGSSLYPPNPEIMLKFGPPSYGSLAKVVDVPLLTLSDFIDKYRRPLPDLLKLDVQGAELEILRAIRSEHWAGLLGVQTEVGFVEFYQGQPLFGDVDQFMRSQGFHMFDLLPVRSYRFEGEDSHAQLRRHLNLARNRTDISRRLIEADALYIRAPEEILETGDTAKILKLYVTLFLYRFFDEALWLTEAAFKNGRLTAQDQNALVSLIKQAAPRPSLLQRADRVGRLARKVSRITGIGRSRKSDFWLERSWDF